MFNESDVTYAAKLLLSASRVLRLDVLALLALS